MSTYNIGQRIELKGTCKRLSTGALTDPTTVTLRMLSPEGVATEYVYGTDDIVRASTGIYTYEFTVPTTSARVRKWSYRWIGTGDCEDQDEEQFAVRQSQIA